MSGGVYLLRAKIRRNRGLVSRPEPKQQIPKNCTKEQILVSSCCALRTQTSGLLDRGFDAMKAEIISIGSELTSGQNLDTNAQWLSQRLAEIGIPVGWHTTVADDFDDNVEAFRSASGRAELILITGGLGP